jgi:regulator of protease activity HflC (stomatin/prohibitin superfamily)
MSPQVSFGWILAGIILLIIVFRWINILKEYERGVVFTLGRVDPNPRGPGLVFVFWTSTASTPETWGAGKRRTKTS